MIQENEIVMFVLALGVLIFLLINYSNLRCIPSFKSITAGFCVFTLGWAMTILEGFFWTATLNILEHLCYAIGAILMVFWLWQVFGKTRSEN